MQTAILLAILFILNVWIIHGEEIDFSSEIDGALDAAFDNDVSSDNIPMGEGFSSGEIPEDVKPKIDVHIPEGSIFAYEKELEEENFDVQKEMKKFGEYFKKTGFTEKDMEKLMEEEPESDYVQFIKEFTIYYVAKELYERRKKPFQIDVRLEEKLAQYTYLSTLEKDAHNEYLDDLEGKHGIWQEMVALNYIEPRVLEQMLEIGGVPEALQEKSPLLQDAVRRFELMKPFEAKEQKMFHNLHVGIDKTLVKMMKSDDIEEIEAGFKTLAQLHKSFDDEKVSAVWGYELSRVLTFYRTVKKNHNDIEVPDLDELVKAIESDIQTKEKEEEL